MASRTAAKPLAPGSPRLARSRYHVDIHGPRNDRGAYPFIAEGRFASFESAKAWADAEHPDAAIVNVTFRMARDGWQAHPAGERREGVWS